MILSVNAQNLRMFGVSILSYDFSKAFDKLPTQTIIDSIVSNSFPINFIDWLKSNYMNRKEYIRHGQCSSKPACAPEGSLISPAIFACTMDSINCINSNCLMLKNTDDVTCICPILKNF